MFTLIVYILFQGPYYSSTFQLETAVVDGFKTEQDCLYAGAQSEVTTRTMVSTKKYLALTHEFICVKKDK